MLGLFPNEARDQLAAANRAPDADPIHPGFFAGMGSAALQGVAEGAIKTVAPLMQGSQVDLGQAMSPNPDFTTPRDEPLEETKPEDLAFQQREATQRVVKAFSPDPYTTGWAGNMLHGLLSVGERAVAGSFVAGPIGAAGLAGTTEGFNTSQEMQQQGVDSTTANTAGAVTGAFTGAGVVAPGLGGIGSQLLTKVATGAIANVAFGAANRGSMSAVLDNAGYSAMAKQYKVLDSQAMISDAVMGVGFGAISHAFHPSPSAIDSAHTVADAVHVESDLAPGVPVTQQARDIHVQNITDATTALMNDEPVSVKEMPETINNPAQDSEHIEAQRAYLEATSNAFGDSGFDTEREYLMNRADAYDGGALIASQHERDLYGTQLRNLQGELELAGNNKTRADQLEKEDIAALGPELAASKAYAKIRKGVLEKESEDKKTAIQDQIVSVSDKYIRAATESDRLSQASEALTALRKLERQEKAGTYGTDQNVTPDITDVVPPISKIETGGAETPIPASRRIDDIERARIVDLLKTQQGRKLKANERDELLGLLQRERLSARVNGRRISNMGNATAYAEMLGRGEGKAAHAFFDLDMFKSINDELGHATGDDAIRTAGETAAHYLGEGNAFYRGGDEFMAQAHTPEELQAAMAKLSQHLANHKLRAYDAQGNVTLEKQGIKFSYGIGRDIAEAEHFARLQKADKLRAGLRSERGQSNDRPVVQKPTAERGKGGGSEATGAEASLDPQTQDAYSAAQAALERNPDLTIEHPETGEVMTAQEAMQRATEDLSAAKQEGVLHQIAAACFGRG